MKRRLLRIHRKLDRGSNSLNKRTRSSVASAVGLLKRCNSYNFKKAVNFSSLLKRVKIKTRKRK